MTQEGIQQMSKRIMVVDDSRLVRVQMEDVLAGTEYEIAAYCRSGEDAIARYAEVQPDLVTMDIIMPGMDGLETARTILEAHPEAKIVLQSIPPVGAKQEAKKTYVNNERIAAYNEVIKTLAEEKACYFLDVAACLTGGDGLLPKDWNFDGIHLNPAGCKVWLNYLRTHSLEDGAAEA